MDFKIKIDLSNQQIINDTPVTKKKHKKKASQEKEVRIDTLNKEPNEDKKFIRNNPENKRKKLILVLGDYEHILIKFLEKDKFFT